MAATADTSLSALIGMPPERAIQYLADKGNRITFGWREMTGPEHAKDFTVAKAATLDLLGDIRQAVTKALEEGQTQRMFDRDLIPILQAKGWWGLKEVTNPDGEKQMVQLGSPRRLETIFRTNLQTAYMAGRHQQLLENAADRPYWQYVAVMDGRTRAAHAALNGTVFRYDDPVWNHIYPPNGYRCRCRVTALSESRLQKSGLEVASSEGYLTPVEISDGERLIPTVSLKMPGMQEGFVPDPGWDYNPGKASGRWDKNGLVPDCSGDGAAFAEGRDCIKALPAQPDWKSYSRPDLREVDNDFRLPSPSILKPGRDVSDALSILQSALKVSVTNPLRVIKTPVDPVIIRAERLSHLVLDRKDTREIYANYIVPTLEKPYDVWLTAYDDGKYRKHYIGLFQDQKDLFSVVREAQDGDLLWNVIRMRDRSLNGRRIGNLIWKDDRG